MIAAVDFARTNDLPLAVRGGGHSPAGYGTIDGGLVLDLSPMKRLDIDPERRVASAQGGLTWGEYNARTHVDGLATPGGDVAAVGIAGLTLAGGMGWLMRKHGMTIDNLLAVELVTADGRLVTATETEHHDLFWALRGGGGNFGIATGCVTGSTRSTPSSAARSSTPPPARVCGPTPRWSPRRPTS